MAEVRQPDEYYSETLCHGYNDSELDLAINMSLEEQFEKNKIEIAIEKSILEGIQMEKQKELDEKQKRIDKRNKYKELLLRIKRVGFYDTKLKDFYEIIRNMIDEICERNNESYKVDDSLFSFLTGTLKTIRLTNEDKELISNLFILDKN